MEESKYVTIELSEDGKIITKSHGIGKLIVPPSVEDLAKPIDGWPVLTRHQVPAIIFSEGCEIIGPNWGDLALDVLDHNDGAMKEIFLPSTIKKVESRFPDYPGLESVWIPKGTKSYFEGILPDSLKKYIKELDK